MRQALRAAILCAALASLLPGCTPGSAPGERRAAEEILGPDGGNMVWVPPGEFMMGADDSIPDQRPVHRVSISQGFWLGKYAVTNDQYRRFCHETGRRFPKYSDQPPSHPVLAVNWYDANAYCRTYGLRLPTEAEWEYAARGPQGRRYPWGDDWDTTKCCNFDNPGPHGKTASVSSFPAGASWCGALGMAGNAWQWCADWYGWWYYSHSPEADPLGQPFGTLRVLRGGSWLDYPSDCRSSFRNAGAPDRRKITYGFRCVMPSR